MQKVTMKKLKFLHIQDAMIFTLLAIYWIYIHIRFGPTSLNIFLVFILSGVLCFGSYFMIKTIPKNVKHNYNIKGYARATIILLTFSLIFGILLYFFYLSEDDRLYLLYAFWFCLVLGYSQLIHFIILFKSQIKPRKKSILSPDPIPFQIDLEKYVNNAEKLLEEQKYLESAKEYVKAAQTAKNMGDAQKFKDYTAQSEELIRLYKSMNKMKSDLDE